MKVFTFSKSKKLSLYAVRLCSRPTFYKLPTPDGLELIGRLHRVYERKSMRSLLEVRLQRNCSLELLLIKYRNKVKKALWN